MAQVEKSTGIWPADYLPIELPAEAEFVWEVFWEIRRGIKSGFGGAEAMGFMEIDAWQRVRSFRLGNQIVDMLLAMDAAYMREANRESSPKRSGN